MLKIRRPLGRLIFNMGIAIPGKTVFLIETAPWTQQIPCRIVHWQLPAEIVPTLNYMLMWFYILYKEQYCVFQSLKRKSRDSNKPRTKLQLPIVHVNSPCQYTVRCRYNAVNFLTNIHKRHPITRPLGRDMGCLLWSRIWLIFCPSSCNYSCNSLHFWTAL